MKKFLLVIVGVLIGAGAVYVSDPHFWNRYTGLLKAYMFKEPRGQWYSPLADVVSTSGEALAKEQAAEDLAAAIDQAETYAKQHNSLSFAVWHNGKLLRESYFGETKDDTLIVSKSMAKPLASMVMARAFEQGYFKSLDQSASDFITEWKGSDKAAITLRHILSMSTGMERFYQQTVNPFSNFHKAFLSGKHEDIIINDIPLVEEPGSYYDYSQPVSDLVAVLIQRATKQKYEEYLATQLLKPIQATGGEIWLNREDGVAHSGCCVMLPTDTWLRLGVLMAQDGVWQGKRMLPDWWNKEILKGSQANPNYGLYFWLGTPHVPRRHFVDPDYLPNPGTLQSEPYAADDLFMFDGNGNQVIYIVPSRKLVIVRTGGWPGKGVDGKEWDNTFIANTIIRAADKPTTKPSDGPPPFSAAMQQYKGLDTVGGELKPMSDVVNESAELRPAIELAQRMDSYALLVWHKGELRTERYFNGFDKELRPETASMHKSVLALLFLAALDDGLIQSLDEPLANYIPQWQDSPEGQISIRSMLTMSSGLRVLSAEGGMASPRMKFFTDGANARNTLLAMKRASKPDTVFEYANTNSQILCLVLEAATGQPYTEYLSNRLWQRIGAADAHTWNYEENGFPRTYASLLARPRDWLRVGLLIKDNGKSNGEQIISRSNIAALTKPSTTNANYGLHTWLGNKHEDKRFYNDAKTGPSFAAKQPFSIDDMVYFDGIGGQRVYISQKADLVIVRVGDMRFDWDDTELPNAVLKALNKE